MTGIPFVIVNGTVVVRDANVLADLKSGQTNRYPVEDDTGAHEVLFE